MKINDKLLNRSGIGRVVLFFLLTIPFFQIDYLAATISWMPRAYALCQMAAGLIIIFLIIKDRLIKKIPKLFVLFLALFFVMTLSSFLNGLGIKRSLEYVFATFAMCLLMFYGISKDLRSFLKAEVCFFGLLTVLNFISVLVFRNGMYSYLNHYNECWLLGFKSGHIMYQMPFLFFTAIYSSLYLKNSRKWLILPAAELLVLASTIKVMNRTALLVLIPVIILTVIPKLRNITPVFNIVTYAGIGLVMNLIFVVFRKQSLFEWLIVGIFHRRMDLTYRTDVWDKTFQAITQKPVLGHGFQTFVFSDTIETTHNEFLEILFKTGIIGLVIFLAIIICVIYRLFKNRKNAQAQWIALFTGAFFLMFVMEQYAFVYFLYLFVFAFFAQNLEKLKDEQDQMYMAKLLNNNEAGRTEKSARNVLFTVFASVTAILIGLIAQKLFIQILGLEYAGLNGLFNNVISMLAIADLGIGEAVVFHLYRPLKENDRETIRSLMRFYRKAFHIVSLVVAVIGVCLIPVLPYIAKTAEADVNTTVIYLIFLADVVLSYFLSYKRAILYADQKNYYISIIHMVYLVGMNTAQLLMLYFTRNYYAYLIAKVVFRILENVVITYVANRQYPYLKEADVRPLAPEIRFDIRKKTGALLFHKIGTFIVNGTDNILISVFFNLKAAGLYSNYYLVIDALTKLFTPALAALTPSVGDMLVSESKEHIFLTFRRIRFINFWMASFAGTSLFVLIQPFISIWFGREYLLSFGVTATLALQFFQLMMRGSYNSFQDAAGIFYENRFVPLVESALNIISSIILLKIFGLAGVFAGTIISSLALWGFSYPKFVYAGLFGRSIRSYISETVGYLGVFVIVCAAAYGAVSLVNSCLAADGLMLLIADGIICFVVTNGLMALIFIRSDCFKYFTGLLTKVCRR
ncbi:MAG: O-antigen ligase family protein [Parasporobacterium sp.]|nr:O-antigen ligase family protein [Parasporobacterium sp.]